MYKIVSKILIIQFIAVFILQLFCLILLISPSTSQATVIEFKPQIEIPGTEKELTKTTSGGFLVPQSTELIAKYIKIFYKYAIGIVGILAAVVLMFGGMIWLTAGGSAERIGQAKSWIAASLTGLLLALTSYLILATVNPALVNLKITTLPKVENVPEAPAELQPAAGCCDGFCHLIKTKTQCELKGGTWKPEGNFAFICSVSADGQTGQCLQTSSKTSGCCFINRGPTCQTADSEKECKEKYCRNDPWNCTFEINKMCIKGAGTPRCKDMNEASGTW